MARGLAILTTRVGAVESVVDESNGWFVAPGDSVGLANTLRNIIHSDRNLIKQKQQNSQKRITSFLWENIADSTINHIANKH